MPAFRFLHASDFHLERPPAGLAELPDHIRDVLVEAPYQAATNVFEAALAHEVDFILLAGDIVAPKRSGPRAVLFLCEQFRRLAERNIDVYWVGGMVEQFVDWPKEIQWPANLHIFASDQPERFQVTRQGKLLCEIVGQSLPVDGEIDPQTFADEWSAIEKNCFAIGLLNGNVDEHAIELVEPGNAECPPAQPACNGLEQAANSVKRDVQPVRIDYWALGGEHEPTLPQEIRPVVHYPGSPQGRSPSEVGPHGCTLVEVSDSGDILTKPVVTDTVRFAHERLTLPALTLAPSSDIARRLGTEIEQLLRERLQLLADANPSVILLVDFTFDGEPLARATRLHVPLPTIAGVLRGEFGYRTPPVWLSRIHLPPPPPVPQHWLEQDTLLGDVLRAARHFQESGQAMDLERFLPTGPRRETICDFIAVDDPMSSRTAIGEAAALVASLLGPEEARR